MRCCDLRRRKGDWCGDMTGLTYLDVSRLPDGGFEKMCAALSEERRKKVEAHICKKDRLLSAAAGYLLSCALEERGLGGVQILYGGCGKPYVNADGFFFNLSHSGDIAVCAVSDGEVGVDIQKIAPVNGRLLKRVCTQSELRYIASAGEGEESAFCRVWTVKESVIKQLGAGLSLSPARVEVSFGERIGARIDGAECNLHFCEYSLEGYRITACARTEDFSTRLREIKA